MIVDHLGTLSQFLLEQASATNFNLQGPAEVEYGFGWEPTVTFWSDDRRVHFYFERNGMAAEVAEIQPGLKVQRGLVETNSFVQRTIIQTTGEAWNIVDCFLRQRCNFENLPSHHWIVDTLDHDKFIPHPPSAPHAGNIESLVKVMQQVGKPWHRPRLYKNQSWLQRIHDWFQKQGKDA